MAILAAFSVVFVIAYCAGYEYGRKHGTLETIQRSMKRKDNND